LKPTKAHGPLALYVVLVVGVAAGLLVKLWTDSDLPTVPPIALAFWFFLTLAAEIFWLPAPGSRGMISMSMAANIAVLFVLPRPHALAVAALGVAFSDLLLHKRGLTRALFNAAQTTLALAAASFSMSLLSAPASPMGSQTFLLLPLATLAPLPVFVLLNTGLVSTALSLEGGAGPWTTWKQNYATPFQLTSSGLLFSMGLALVVGVESVGYVGGLAALPFLFLLKDAHHHHIRNRARALSAG
jgi:hypothetical protein